MTEPETPDLPAAVRRFGKAWAAGDTAVLEALVAPGYAHVDASGRPPRPRAWLAYAALRTGRSTEVAFDELTVRHHGDLAIVVGLNRTDGAGTRSAIDTRLLAIRFTQVWVLQDGHWRREAFQATPPGAPPFG